jgi:hypothetical protein
MSERLKIQKNVKGGIQKHSDGINRIPHLFVDPVHPVKSFDSPTVPNFGRGL